jgi:hypothetical protein
MRQLFQFGYDQGYQGPPWRKTLPATYTVPTASPARTPARTVAQQREPAVRSPATGIVP